MTKRQPKTVFVLQGLLSGLLLSAGWPSGGFPLILLVAFVPLLGLQERAESEKLSGRTFFMLTYPAFLTWNVLSTWWVCNATIPGGIMALVFNALFMNLVFWLFHITKIRFGKWIGYFSL